jgi:23S rRNA (adenine2030-N6)-methyltransferase
MNYRHAFHAGNQGDCLKHALLVWLLTALRTKEKPFFVLDTHAGAGRYDLSGPEASRTGEWRTGIGRLLPNPPEALADYVRLHPEAHAALRAAFARDPAVAVHRRDGWEALRGLLPPAQRRGLVLIDPPYEREDEMERLVDGLALAAARFPGGVLAAWYPIKHRAPVRALHDRLRDSGLHDIVAAELCLRAPTDAARLNGSGLLVVRPPYRFEAEAGPILAALLNRLGDGEPGAEAGIVRIVDE